MAKWFRIKEGVVERTNGSKCGVIQWDDHDEKYRFYPNENYPFDAADLTDISGLMRNL